MCTGFELPVFAELFGGAGAAAGVGEAAGAFGALDGGIGALAAEGIGAGELGLGLGGELGAGLWGGDAALGAGLFGSGEGLGALGALNGLSSGAGSLGSFGPLGEGASSGLGQGGSPGLGQSDLVGGGLAGDGSLAGGGVANASIPFGASAVDPFMTNLSVGGTAAATPSMFDSALGAFQKYGQPAMSAISGLEGLQRARQMRAMAQMAAKKADPWGTSGGRSLADTQLQELMRDPSQVAQNDPAFKLRIMGAQRANAQYGQDSGAMSVAGANASTSWYNERLAQLGGLAGTGVHPGTAGQIGLQGLGSAADLESSALGSLGYAAGGAGAGRGGLTPLQQQALLKLMGG